MVIIKHIILVLVVVCFVHSMICCGASAKKKTKISKRITNNPKIVKICCKVKKGLFKSAIGKSQKYQNPTTSSSQKLSSKHAPTSMPTSLPYLRNMLKHIPNDDPCASWMGCPTHHNPKVKTWFLSLPACPCHLPPYKLFYNNTVYDQVQKKSFSWKILNGKYEMLSIFKLGATYCIRQLFDPVSKSPAIQQCCYDKSYQLITRGSGAGTPNLIAPELDFNLHNKFDLKPYIFCQGDWTRYQAIRRPNNGYNCTANPGLKQFIEQVMKARDY